MKELIGKLEIIKSSSNSDYVKNALIEAIQAISQSEWISVEDRLPETNCDVLVVKNNGKIVQMSFHAPFDSGKRLFQYWSFGKWIDQHSQITHWKLLTPPPQTK